MVEMLLLLIAVCTLLISPVHSELPITRRVLGGTDVADSTVAPYAVSIQSDGHHCAGAILTNHFIVTAAHCVNDSDFSILAGTHDLSDKSAGQTYTPLQTYMHEQFNTPQFANDIAVVKTKERIVFNDNIQSIQMYSKKIPADSELRFVGWGATTTIKKGKKKSISRLLQWLTYREAPFAECQRKWRKAGGIEKGNICAMNAVGKGACTGDSGGPLVYNGQLVGVASYVAPCGKGVPDVFAAISYYYKFICKIIKTCGLIIEIKYSFSPVN